MGSSRVCIKKSLDLAKKQCVQKTNLLVYEHNPCNVTRRDTIKRKDYVPRIPCADAKQIRICTAKELKKMCPPPKCSCDPNIDCDTESAFMNLLKSTAKGIFAAGLVYLSVQMGIWGDSCETHALYKKICEMFVAKEEFVEKNYKWDPPSCEAESDFFTKHKTHPCDQPFMDHEKGSYRMQELYNKAVYMLFSSIAGFPFNIINFVRCCLLSRPDDDLLIAGESDCEDDEQYTACNEGEEAD